MITSAYALNINDIKSSISDGVGFIDTVLSIPSGTDAIQVYDNDNATTTYAALDPIWLFVDSGILKFNIQPIIDSISSTAANAHGDLVSSIAVVDATISAVSLVANSAQASVAGIASYTGTFLSNFNDLNANLYATGTSMTCTNASTTNCFMPKAMYTKVNALPKSDSLRVQTNSTGDYTWTYSTSFSSAPVVTAVAESGTTTSSFNVQLVSRSSTQAVFKVYSTTPTNILGSLLGAAPVATQAFIDLVAAGN